jgi:hypothetical protein
MTPERMARLSCTSQITGLTHNGDFFVGLPGCSIVAPHISLQMGSLYLQGSTGDNPNTAFDAFLNQVKAGFGIPRRVQSEDFSASRHY